LTYIKLTITNSFHSLQDAGSLIETTTEKFQNRLSIYIDRLMNNVVLFLVRMLSFFFVVHVCYPFLFLPIWLFLKQRLFLLKILCCFFVSLNKDCYNQQTWKLTYLKLKFLYCFYMIFDRRLTCQLEWSFLQFPFLTFWFHNSQKNYRRKSSFFYQFRLKLWWYKYPINNISCVCALIEQTS
jgi:hypothetical protein